MSRLSYASVDEAFKLGSDQIKDVQEEIKKLKELVFETGNKKPKPTEKVNAVFEKKQPEPEPPKPYQNQDTSVAKDLEKNNNVPQFEDIVNKYISEKYPQMKETPLKSTISKFGINAETAFKETFGELCSNIKNITIFFIISILVYIMMSIHFDN
jgi:hypothetical protein